MVWLEVTDRESICSTPLETEFLQSRMLAIYNLLKWRATPEACRDHIRNNDALGNVAKLRADHLHLYKLAISTY
jgi:hypothetical protein